MIKLSTLRIMNKNRPKNFFNIVLYNPEIPQNSGNIARMCVANDLKLHFIKPLGFEIDDKYLKRSAMDYWQDLDYSVHENWEAFLKSEQFISHNACENKSGNSLYILSSKVSKSFWDVSYKTGDYLVFGSESSGVPKVFNEMYGENFLTVPMSSGKARCLNLASTAQTVYYEAYRQNY
ncbi:MAG: tRNA (cytidine(34)-2'-O)-methyltransferase [Candidatus Caenarcaniphilales bacterium]|nr:tRNA (cytidine(34)-2'-O)-methyltransferase [Candidatus Caenarcaniphilales bacterium]